MRPIPVTILHGDHAYALALGRALGLADPSIRIRILQADRGAQTLVPKEDDPHTTGVLLADSNYKEKLNEYSNSYKHTLWLSDDPVGEDRENHCYHKHCGRNTIAAAIRSLVAVTPGVSMGGTLPYGRRIGVAAATGGVGTSVVALGLARILALARSAPVQYLSFEPQPVTDLYFTEKDSGNSPIRRTGNDLLYYLHRGIDSLQAVTVPDCLLRDAWGVTSLRPGYGGNEWATVPPGLGESALATAAALGGAERTVVDFSLAGTETSRWLYATCDPLVVVHDGSETARMKNARGLERLEAEGSRAPGVRQLIVHNKWRPADLQPGKEDECCIEWDPESFRSNGGGIQIGLDRSFGIGVGRIIAELDLDG